MKNPLAEKLKMHSHSTKTWTDSPTIPHEHGGSREQGTAVGSGSRPTKSSVKIETSAPDNCHTLDRNPPDPLK